MLTPNCHLAQVRAAATQAFAPDVSLAWSRTMHCWIPLSLTHHAIVRQLHHGRTTVKECDLDAFTEEAGKHGLTVETIRDEHH